MSGGIHNAAALGGADAGTRTTKITAHAQANFDEHQGGVAVAHNQVYLAAAPTRCAVIACDQGQALFAQILQGAQLGCIAAQDWNSAAAQLLDSASARAAPMRYQALANILRSGGA